jgi:DNA-binding CsgD family transcriptional regulator
MDRNNADARPRPDWGHAAPAPGTPAPPPPYQLRDCSFAMVGAQFDRDLVRSLLPPELEPSDEASGGFYMYVAPRGWAVAPFTATLAWLDIKGYDSADGSSGRYQIVSHYSDPIHTVADGWNRLARRGYCHMEHDGEVVRAEGGPDGHLHLRLALRPASGAPGAVAGTHYYLMFGRDGHLARVPVAYSYDFRPAEILAFDNLAPPVTLLGRMTPGRLHWAGWLDEAVITIGAPVAVELGGGDVAGPTIHLNLLSQLGRAALIVGGDRTIQFRNEAATRLLSGAATVSGGLLHASDRASDARLFGAIEQLLRAGPSPLDPVALARPAHDHPLLAYPMLLDRPDVLGAAGRVLLLVTDPSAPAEHDPARALQILGLTPAEARIAALVGGGASPREAADRLRNTAQTVRSALTLAFAKLGLRRQSELARLVARIDSAGL